MKPQQRQRQILARLRAPQTELSVEELVKKFSVSAQTMRRDLDLLEIDLCPNTRELKWLIWLLTHWAFPSWRLPCA